MNKKRCEWARQAFKDDMQGDRWALAVHDSECAQCFPENAARNREIVSRLAAQE
jgi:hypothetical protein